MEKPGIESLGSWPAWQRRGTAGNPPPPDTAPPPEGHRGPSHGSLSHTGRCLVLLPRMKSVYCDHRNHDLPLVSVGQETGKSQSEQSAQSPRQAGPKPARAGLWWREVQRQRRARSPHAPAPQLCLSRPGVWEVRIPAFQLRPPARRKVSKETPIFSCS